MNQQQTIFDGSFDRTQIPRRRELMPGWLKVYTWVTICLGAVILFNAFAQVHKTSNNTPEGNDVYSWMGILSVEIISIAVFLLPGLLVWFEAKWAIWFNYILAALWIITILLLGALITWQYVTLGSAMVYFVPLWLGLFPIRRKWTAAASGRALRKKIPS